MVSWFSWHILYELYGLHLHGFDPPLHYNGGLNLKICQNFVGKKSFLTFVGG